ncbi:hypothetical protein D3C76_1513430 [compost metagenome]
MRFSVTSPTASSSKPFTSASPIGRLMKSLPVRTMFSRFSSYTAALSRMFWPGGSYLMPSSYCLPVLGSKISPPLPPGSGWNDSA